MKIQSKLNTKLLVNVFPWVSLILVVAVFGVASKGLLFSAYNLKTIFSQSVLFIIGGLGLSFLFAQGAFDLSFGSVVCFASLLAAKTVEVTGVDLLIFVIPFVVCIGIGILNGLLYSRVGLVVFIQTLGVSFLLKGTFTTLLGPIGHIKVPKVLNFLIAFRLLWHLPLLRRFLLDGCSVIPHLASTVGWLVLDRRRPCNPAWISARQNFWLLLRRESLAV